MNNQGYLDGNKTFERTLKKKFFLKTPGDSKVSQGENMYNSLICEEHCVTVGSVENSGVIAGV